MHSEIFISESIFFEAFSSTEFVTASVTVGLSELAIDSSVFPQEESNSVLIHIIGIILFYKI